MSLSILDDQRVLAQHREIHTVFGSLLSKKRGYQHHPVVKLYAGEHLPCLVSYHDATLEEFLRRGWHGHRTPVSAEVLQLSEQRRTSATCTDWAEHVKREVSDQALPPAQGLHLDMHDLVKRWTREGKLLYSLEAWKFVIWHAAKCASERCAYESVDLSSKFLCRVDLGEEAA